jgi:hypothetical protein
MTTKVLPPSPISLPQHLTSNSRLDLVIAVGDEAGERCRRLKSVTPVEAQRVGVEGRGTDPQIARAKPDPLLLEPAKNGAANASSLKRRQKREELEIRPLEPREADRDRARLFTPDLNEIA